MSEAPKKIWMADYELNDVATWEWDEGTPYIHADIVDELVTLLKQDLEWMENGDEIGYGSDYYNKVKAALKKLEESHERLV